MGECSPADFDELDAPRLHSVLAHGCLLCNRRCVSESLLSPRSDLAPGLYSEAPSSRHIRKAKSRCSRDALVKDGQAKSRCSKAALVLDRQAKAVAAKLLLYRTGRSRCSRDALKSFYDTDVELCQTMLVARSK